MARRVPLSDDVPQVAQSAERFKHDIVSRNNAALFELIRHYRRIWQRLETMLKRLLGIIAKAAESGEDINHSWLERQSSYVELMNQLQLEIAAYSTRAVRIVTAQQLLGAKLGERNTIKLIRVSLGNMPSNLRRAGYKVTWNRVHTSALQNLIGVLSDGSPLDYKFSDMSRKTARAVKDAMVDGFALGDNPHKIARAMRKASGGLLKNSQVMARTECMRAYREASYQSYRANSQVMKGWIWACARSSSTCAACWAMDGTFHTIDERMSDHPSGRCAQIPVTKSWVELFPGSGVESDDTAAKPWDSSVYFDKLSESDKLKILGKARYSLYSSGKLKLGDMATLKENRIWGDSYHPSSIKDLIRSGKITDDDLLNP